MATLKLQNQTPEEIKTKTPGCSVCWTSEACDGSSQHKANCSASLRRKKKFKNQTFWMLAESRLHEQLQAGLPEVWKDTLNTL